MYPLLLLCWKRVFVVTSVFFWQNCYPLPCSYWDETCTPGRKLCKRKTSYILRSFFTGGEISWDRKGALEASITRSDSVPADLRIRNLSSFTASSQAVKYHPDFFFFFSGPTWLCGDLSCYLGCLGYSTSIPRFL